ncbi:MAG: hypothetical protein R2749_02890 [Acidimicrobiales bacterium]
MADLFKRGTASVTSPFDLVGSTGRAEIDGTGDGEHGVEGFAEASDEAFPFGDGLDVLAFGVADPSSPDAAGSSSDVGGQPAPRSGTGHHDHQAGTAVVEGVSGHDHRRAASRLLPSDGLTEIDQPHVTPAHPAHCDPSASTAFRRCAPLRSPATGAVVTQFVVARTELLEEQTAPSAPTARRAAASSAAPLRSPTGRTDPVASLTRIVVLMPPVYLTVDRMVYERSIPSSTFRDVPDHTISDRHR